MRELAGYVKMLAEVSGSPEQAERLAVQISHQGIGALGEHDDARTRLLRRKARELGVVDGDGTPVSTRAAELVLVAGLYRDIVPPPLAAEVPARLLFTDPFGETQDYDRIDLYVADVIRNARLDLRIGSGFWNEAGIAYLRPVLEPAVIHRHVETSVYAHRDDSARVDQVLKGLGQTVEAPNFRVLWYSGPPNSLMHAKFVVADRSSGYLGTANLTSLGFTHHIEVGVELTEHQSYQLFAFLDRLVSEEFFEEHCTRATARPR